MLMTSKRMQPSIQLISLALRGQNKKARNSMRVPGPEIETVWLT